MKFFMTSVYVIFMTTQVFSKDQDSRKKVNLFEKALIERPDFMKSMMLDADKKCKKMFLGNDKHLTQEEIDEGWDGEFEDQIYAVVEHYLSYYFFCYYRNISILINENEINEKVLEAYLNVVLEGKTKEEIEEAMNDCNKVKGVDHETAAHLTKCIVKHGGNVKKFLQ